MKIRGLRIELGEIEARLLEQPVLKDAVVVARGERLVAYGTGEPAELDSLAPASTCPTTWCPLSSCTWTPCR